MSEERYQTIEQSIIKACQEVKAMRAGKLPKPSLADLWAELDNDVDEESSEKKKIAVAI